jgi:hypothetical protein
VGAWGWQSQFVNSSDKGGERAWIFFKLNIGAIWGILIGTFIVIKISSNGDLKINPLPFQKLSLLNFQ